MLRGHLLTFLNIMLNHPNNYNSVWAEAAINSGLSVGRGYDKVCEINSVWGDAAIRSGKSIQCG